MDFAELAVLIKGRRSIRAWQDTPVPESALVRAIELATWAPNAGNKQNWRFYVITSRTTINAIADAVQARAAEIAGWPEATRFGGEAARWRDNAGFFRKAPAAIAVAVSQYQSLADMILALREKTDARANEIREWRRQANATMQTVGSVVANLLLVLHQMGLGAVWMVGPMQAKGEIEKMLGVPGNMDLVTLVPVGYAAEKPASPGRRPVTEVCEFIR